MRTSRRRRLLFGIVSAWIATVTCLLLAEIALRVFHVGPEISVVRKGRYRVSSNPVLRYELSPGYADGEFAISAAGLRSREHPEEKPLGTFRIALLGDSIAFGHGLDRPDTFAAILEAMLNRHFADSATTVRHDGAERRP